MRASCCTRLKARAGSWLQEDCVRLQAPLRAGLRLRYAPGCRLRRARVLQGREQPGVGRVRRAGPGRGQGGTTVGPGCGGQGGWGEGGARVEARVRAHLQKCKQRRATLRHGLGERGAVAHGAAQHGLRLRGGERQDVLDHLPVLRLGLGSG